MAMLLTPEQQALLNGEKGETMAKVVKTLVMYGETFGAEKMVPVTGGCGHLVTSFGLSVMKPVYALMDQLIDSGVLSGQKFSADPRPLDPNVPKNVLQDLFFKVMYSKQASYEKQLQTLGLLNEDSFTCACYMDEVGNKPNKGEVLSWAESSAVVYANSVLGARCNRNSGILELFGSIAGFVPYFGLLTDEGRKATWIVEIKTTGKPEAQILGSAIGMKVMEDVPYVGADKFLGTELERGRDATSRTLARQPPATARSASTTMKASPRKRSRLGEKLIAPARRLSSIDDAELERVARATPASGRMLL